MTIATPSDAPHWLQETVRSIEFWLREQSLPEYAIDTLPDPTEHRSELVMMVDLKMVAMSNGTHWKRIDTGAIL